MDSAAALLILVVCGLLVVSCFYDTYGPVLKAQKNAAVSKAASAGKGLGAMGKGVAMQAVQVAQKKE